MHVSNLSEVYVDKSGRTHKHDNARNSLDSVMNKILSPSNKENRVKELKIKSSLSNHEDNNSTAMLPGTEVNIADVSLRKDDRSVIVNDFYDYESKLSSKPNRFAEMRLSNIDL